MKKLFLVLFLVLAFPFVAFSAVNKYGCTGLTGGTAGTLDALDITGASTPNADNLADGDIAFVYTISGSITIVYPYIFDADGTDAEDSPSVIRPDDYATAGVWRLSTLYSSDVTTPPGPSPALTFYDSDLLGADKYAASIEVNGTTLTDGAEVTDMGQYYMNAGTKTLAILIDGSDNQVEFQIPTTFQTNDIIASEIADFYAYDTIPIAWMKDGSSAPAALDDASTRTPYVYRDFDSAADEDLNFVWFVPSDLSGTTIQYRVRYLITNATGPSAEGVAFGLSGVSFGDNDATNGAKGTVVVVTDTSTAAQHDILITDWSGDVTVTNLAAGEVAEMALIRDVSDAADDYAQDVGVISIEIRYVQNPAR